MNIQGKGEQLREEIPHLFRDSNSHDPFKEKWGKPMFQVICDNFLMPVLQADNPQAKAKEIVSKLDLFCAAFV